MSDPQLPPFVRYVNEQTDALRTELTGRIDKLGGEVADERKARELGDKELGEDLTAITTGRLASWSWWVRALVMAGVTIVGGGLITLIVTFIEAASHLTGVKP